MSFTVVFLQAAFELRCRGKWDGLRIRIRPVGEPACIHAWLLALMMLRAAGPSFVRRS